jgi:hypothetical protein
LAGRTYEALIRGNSALISPGTKLPAVTVAGDPSILSTSQAVAALHGSWTILLAPLLLATATGLAAMAWWRSGRWVHQAIS